MLRNNIFEPVVIYNVEMHIANWNQDLLGFLVSQDMF